MVGELCLPQRRVQILQSTPAPLPIVFPFTALPLGVVLVPNESGPAAACVGDGVRPLACRPGRPLPIGEGKCVGGLGEEDDRPVSGTARPGGRSGRYVVFDCGRMVDSGGVASRARDGIEFIDKGVCMPTSGRLFIKGMYVSGIGFGVSGSLGVCERGKSMPSRSWSMAATILRVHSTRFHGSPG